jgi:hypothetical protein
MKDVGHHWTPIGAVKDLLESGVITQEEHDYFLGRSSGPTDPPHRGRHTNAYNDAVKQQITEWSKQNKTSRISQEELVNRIRQGQNLDGTPNPALNILNKGVRENLPKYPGNRNPYDSGTDQEIMDRGRSHAEQRAKDLSAAKLRRAARLLEGAFIASLIGNNADAAEIIMNGEGMAEARRALEAGDLDTFQRALAGLSTVNGSQSTFNELLLKGHRDTAFLFKRAVELYIKQLRSLETPNEIK